VSTYIAEAMREDGIDRVAWRLLPSEEPIWRDRPTRVPRDRFWVLLPIFFGALALVAGLFASLLRVEALPGVHQSVASAALLAAAALAATFAPQYLFGELEYLLTDKRVICKRGRFVRSMERRRLTYGRIRWHRSVPVVGHLELVVAVPFGPLARRWRIVLRDLREPDTVLALVRGTEPSEHAGDADTPLMDRLEIGETVLWGGHPEGLHFGWREVLTASLGASLIALGMLYGYRNASILLDLEGLGLAPRSVQWWLLFSAVCISWVCILSVGIGMAWWGLIRSRRLGEDTEYVLTDRRVLIRRGRVELSVDRRRVVDVASQSAPRGLHHLFLVLDAPHSRALADSGALRPVLPSREPVPPVLFEVRDPGPLRELLLERQST